MSKIRLNIDGRELEGFAGQTILDVAHAAGIEIPNLCRDGRVEMYASCGICMVELEGSPKLLRSCSTYAADGMVVRTNTPRIFANRKTALELMLSNHIGDCRPPCNLACPAQTDCQGYVGLIANGEYSQAAQLIKERIPLPASIGRVCPHPCEDACRRELVEEPISICALKQFAADFDIEQDRPYTAQIAEPTGKSVAIVGGGPGGLSAAYFLRARGHDVTVFDAMPQMGGMLRYGIPEYRLPKSVLDSEIDAIEFMGVALCNNIRVGADITLDYLRASFDAVIVAIGAWAGSGLRCPGEELDGVLDGIDFLRDATLGKPVFTGRTVAVVGGGNTAMDVCRTAVRLGAEKVYNIYRRTRNEMPAEEIEIVEAEEEGVIFKNLTNPIKVVGENGKVRAVRLQIMELGEPDASGRRAPVPVEGSEETLEVNTVIAAIGQKTRADGFEALALTKWGTIAADEDTFLTNIGGVFAIGDAVNNGADIAITAIGEAHRAVVMIDKYLSGETLCYKPPYLVKTENKTAEDFADKEKQPRMKILHRGGLERRRDFLPVNLPLSEEAARKEAHRCLECGCHDYFECKLLEYANLYDVQPEKYDGDVHSHPQRIDHPYIRHNPGKCILCGLCVRICDEVVGATAFGLVSRGLDTVVAPALKAPLAETDCISCGQCVTVCPTGALTEKMLIEKQVPLKESSTETTCAYCSLGCQSNLRTRGNLLIRNLPRDESSLLCEKGRFGFGEIAAKERLAYPLIQGEPASFEQAAVFTNKKLQGLQTQYGADCVAVAVSGRYTNEEVRLIKEYTEKVLRAENVFSFEKTRSALEDVFGRDGSTATLDELENTDLIVAVSPKSMIENHGVIGMRIKMAVNRGAKLILVSTEDSLLDGIASARLDSVAALRGMADTLKTTRHAVFVFEQDALTAQDARLLVDIAAQSGHGDKPRSGVIELLPGPNSQGLSDLGIKPREEYVDAINSGKIKGLFLFGEDSAGIDLSGLEFLAVQAIHVTDTAQNAHCFFPASTFAETDGSFTNIDGKVQNVRRAVCAPEWDSSRQIEEFLRDAW